MTEDQRRTLDLAERLCRDQDLRDYELIVTLQKIDRENLFMLKDSGNLFVYLTDVLKRSHPVAYAYQAVSRAAAKCPALQKALADRRLTVPTANRLVSALDKENAEDLVAFACTHTYKEIDREVKRRKPTADIRDRARPISGDEMVMVSRVRNDTYEKFERARAAASKPGQPLPTHDQTLGATFDAYLKAPRPRAKGRAGASSQARAHSFCARKRPRAAVRSRTARGQS